MIIGTGVDLIEVDRIERLLRRKPWPQKIFTKSEVEACRTEGFSFKRTVFRLAGLFAAKEAVMKALGTGWTRGAAWTEIIISHTDTGQPRVQLSGQTAQLADGLGAKRVLVSISHTNRFAMAFAVLENTADTESPAD